MSGPGERANGGGDQAAKLAAQVAEQRLQSEYLFAALPQPQTYGPPTLARSRADAKRAQADATFRRLISDPAAMELVRAREGKATSSTPRIPLYCSGHRTGVAVVLAVDNEVDEWTYVEDHIQMYCLRDPKAGSPGTWRGGSSYTVQCGQCGRSTGRRNAWLLERALACLVKSDTRGYRISLT